MADTTLQPGARPANAPTCTTASRRGLLGVIAAAPVALLPFAPALAAPSTAAWDAALKRVQDANMAIDAAAEIHEEADDAWQVECDKIAPTGLTEREWCSVAEQLHAVALDDLACLYEVPHYRGPEGHGAVIAAKVEAYREQRAVLHTTYRVEELDEAVKEAIAVWKEANAAAFKTPAPTLSALADKIALLDQCEPDRFIPAVLADVRRLAAREA